MDDIMDLEDFDMQPAKYRVMLNVLVDEELEHQSWEDFENPTEACDFAERKTKETKTLMALNPPVNWDGREIEAASITVETVVLVDGEEDYAGQIFNETVYVKENDNEKV